MRRSSALWTLPASVTTPSVELTSTFVSVESRTSAASFALTDALMAASSTWRCGDDVVLHAARPTSRNTAAMAVANRWGLFMHYSSHYRGERRLPAFRTEGAYAGAMPRICREHGH